MVTTEVARHRFLAMVLLLMAPLRQAIHMDLPLVVMEEVRMLGIRMQEAPVVLEDTLTLEVLRGVIRMPVDPAHRDLLIQITLVEVEIPTQVHQVHLETLTLVAPEAHIQAHQVVLGTPTQAPPVPVEVHTLVHLVVTAIHTQAHQALVETLILVHQAALEALIPAVYQAALEVLILVDRVPLLHRVVVEPVIHTLEVLGFHTPVLQLVVAMAHQIHHQEVLQQHQVVEAYTIITMARRMMQTTRTPAALIHRKVTPQILMVLKCQEAHRHPIRVTHSSEQVAHTLVLKLIRTSMILTILADHIQVLRIKTVALTPLWQILAVSEQAGFQATQYQLPVVLMVVMEITDTVQILLMMEVIVQAHLDMVDLSDRIAQEVLVLALLDHMVEALDPVPVAVMTQAHLDLMEEHSALITREATQERLDPTEEVTALMPLEVMILTHLGRLLVARLEQIQLEVMILVRLGPIVIHLVPILLEGPTLVHMGRMVDPSGQIQQEVILLVHLDPTEVHLVPTVQEMMDQILLDHMGDMEQEVLMEHTTTKRKLKAHQMKEERKVHKQPMTMLFHLGTTITLSPAFKMKGRSTTLIRTVISHLIVAILEMIRHLIHSSKYYT